MKNRTESEPQYLVVCQKKKKGYFTSETFPVVFLSAGGENTGKI
jgi:hypothetical protein